jgi:hypothetical protein
MFGISMGEMCEAYIFLELTTHVFQLTCSGSLLFCYALYSLITHKILHC